MRLFIAEKPSLGRAIAAALPKPLQKGEGFIQASNGDVVSWCIGHLLEQAEPDAYNPAFKQWRLDTLPILPEQWQLQPKSSARKQLAVLRKWVKQAQQLVHAGDPDREGQLLVDEVIDYLKVSQQKKQSMQRLLVSDLNLAAVQKALTQLRPNSDFIPLSVSALARSRADWLYGINLTRACTIKGQQSGVQQVLSVGRVQTPVLGLVVRRDQAIEQFVSKPFYEVRAAIHLQPQLPLSFYAQWQPSEACAAHQDEDGRVLNPKLAANVATRIRQQPAEVTAFEQQNKQQAAPLPYSLSSLQVDAGKAFGLSAKQVLDTCQSLYEKHQLITYPRSDCRYLPTQHWGERQTIATAITNTCSKLGDACANAEWQRRSAAWNDAKVGAHHAIVPTAKAMPEQRLTKAEQQIYQLIARQYLWQFYPPYRYQQRRAELVIAGGTFVATQRCTLELGWKSLLPAAAQSSDESATELPELSVGQRLWSGEPCVDDKQTQPPKAFTDASLLAAMTGINRYVSDASLRKVLRDTDGLGTEATRAGIIELLFKRGFLQRQGKSIQATALGKALVNALPASTTLPDTTAHWERQLNDISQRELSYQQFMTTLEQRLRQLLQETSALDGQGFRQLPPAAKPAGRGKRRTSKPRTNQRTKNRAKSRVKN
ncbi:DNA topoisomerase III [Bacterioplanes sanyensis]|uniref:DNA topoisomerase n=1 Tax=Bacterioplanes sanyensis TaxID=1249553 RepID=A0A222FIF5_9GAMM|nr:DNA topoisomerase III [Bacterioplanes sanyensis]ASP38201.1 DNA topoisomerase III [Bacterioplanes sanyensis]